MGGGERATESGARLAIAHIRIGEEDALGSSETVRDLTSLTDKAVLHLHGVDERRAVGDDGVLRDDSRADIDIGIFRGEERAVGQTCGSIDLTVVTDQSVGDFLGVDDLYTVADLSALGHIRVDIITDELTDLVLQLTVMEMTHHESGQLGTEGRIEHHIALSYLIEHAHEIALSIGGTLGGLYRRDIRDIAVITDIIIVDVVADILDQAVVADGDIAQGSITNAGMLEEAFGYLHIALKHADADIAVQLDILHITGTEIVGYLNRAPVLSPTILVFEESNLLICQISIRHNSGLFYSSLGYRKSL